MRLSKPSGVRFFLMAGNSQKMLLPHGLDIRRVSGTATRWLWTRRVSMERRGWIYWASRQPTRCTSSSGSAGRILATWIFRSRLTTPRRIPSHGPSRSTSACCLTWNLWKPSATKTTATWTIYRVTTCDEKDLKDRGADHGFDCDLPCGSACKRGYGSARGHEGRPRPVDRSGILEDRGRFIRTW